jgi:hypothetical protein
MEWSTSFNSFATADHEMRSRRIGGDVLGTAIPYAIARDGRTFYEIVKSSNLLTSPSHDSGNSRQ